MFHSLLIANRGEIAVRIMRTARAMGLRTIAVYSEADRDALHVRSADSAVPIGPASPAESYLSIPNIIAAAKQSGAQAIHPGYGFLSENAAFAEACAAEGIIFVGPPPSAIRAMGLKDRSKELMRAAGVPVVPGADLKSDDLEDVRKAAAAIGYPVMLKAVAGGGGKGMRRVDDPASLDAQWAAARREAKNAFGDDRMLIEKFILNPRHIEVQIFADGKGQAVHLFERDCSIQRRHQKVVEEAPAPGMTAEVRAKLTDAAIAAAKAIGYSGAGTVEFIADGSQGLRPDGFWFLEMNTRLQVEHPVTEAITGLDLVEWQLRVAAGEGLPLTQDQIGHNGHAIEVRLYAEDPVKGFLPSVGRLHRLRFGAAGEALRIDSGVMEGDQVSSFYDPMIAKLIAFGATRTEAARKLMQGLRGLDVAGVETNAAFLAAIMAHPAFIAAEIDTEFLDRHGAALIPGPAVPPARLLALLALDHHLSQTPSPPAGDPFSPWAVHDGFRLQGQAAPVPLALSSGGENHSLQYVPVAGGVMVDGVRISGRRDQDGTLHALIDGLSCRVGTVVIGRRLLAAFEGRTYGFDMPDPLATGAALGAGSGDIRAPMPGRIGAVGVAAGQTVTRGQALITLEAMKMEHALTAPADGLVDAVLASVGEQVTEGQVLVRLASAAEEK